MMYTRTHLTSELSNQLSKELENENYYTFQ